MKENVLGFSYQRVFTIIESVSGDNLHLNAVCFSSTMFTSREVSYKDIMTNTL